MKDWLRELAQHIDPTVTLSLTALMLALLLFVRLQNRLFRMRVKNRRVKVIKGAVPQDFLASCKRLVAGTHMQGTIEAYDTRYGVDLKFRGNFSIKDKEAIRSAFPAYRYHKSFFRHWRDGKDPRKKKAG
ncbi:DUF3634 family protein [Gallaecimonas sp. GXIMD4217]|uniref:DUF3634 family protein n=1 Tax=Gallaecimonas sp. GXIMD4217 TaxID=3131927 RepID=UPI00311B281A